MADDLRRRSMLTSLLGFSSLLQLPSSAQNKSTQAAPATPVTSGKPSGAADTTVTVALITASVTLSGILIKDFLLKFLDEYRASQRAEAAVYERYAKPLAASAGSLLIRMNEIVLQRHRPVYLKCVGVPPGKGPAPTFRAYKKLSTLYRLASVIGWIRACRREFSFMRVASRAENTPIDDAISEFERALADGSWVERERVSRLIDLWKLYNPADSECADEVLEDLGVLVDNAIYDVLEAEGVDDLKDVPAARQPSICREVAQLLSTELKTNLVSGSLLETTWPEAFRILSMREAWVYKDWQDAIGDLMLRRIEDEDRKFEVLGYGDFEALFGTAPSKSQHLVQRLSDILDGVDLSIEDRFDARPRQLRRVARATASLVIAMHAAQGSNSVISTRQLELANSILAKVECG
jgi:hypothetical protein